MADKKISQLTAATTPLAGTEVLPIVQNSNTVKVSVANLTAGRDVSVKKLITTESIGVGLTPSAWGRVAAQINNTSLFEYGANNSIVASNFYFDGAANRYLNNGYASYYQQYNGGHTWSTANSGTAGDSVTSFSDKMSLSNAGDLSLPVGNLVIGTSGKGIDFSATSEGSGTMTSELLADYEEGTWTPSSTFITVVGTFSSSGTYTKIGRQVTVVGTMSATTSITVGATGIVTDGLPYSANKSIGALVNDSSNANAIVYATGPYVVATDNVAPTPSWSFTVTYFV